MRIEIIAEAGVNHNGDLDTALRLVDAAVEAGCDAVKFQTFITDAGYSGEKAEEIRKLELRFSEFVKIRAYCNKRAIEFISTPDDMECLNFLFGQGVRRIKSSSQDVNNHSFLNEISLRATEMIMSTGACTWSEMAKAIEVAKVHAHGLTVLHCVSAYPAPIEEMNLKVIPLIRDMFGVRVGLSDHTRGMESALVAMTLGATMFEKHLTLDVTQEGPDHKSSLEPKQMKYYVNSIRRAHLALGDGVKRVMPSEKANREFYDAFLQTRRERKRC